MIPSTSNGEKYAARTWWFILWMVILTGIAGFFSARPFRNGTNDTYYILLGGVINIFMVSVIGMACWRFYITAQEERFAATRKYVVFVLIGLSAKYLYLKSVQHAALTRCVPSMFEECRKAIEETDYIPLTTIISDLLLFSAVGVMNVVLIKLVFDPIDRIGFDAWIAQFNRLKSDSIKIKRVAVKSSDSDISATETV